MTKKQLEKLYIELKFPRLIEEKMLLLLRQGKISKWFSGIGQEAISVGISSAINKTDSIFSKGIPQFLKFVALPFPMSTMYIFSPAIIITQVSALSGLGIGERDPHTTALKESSEGKLDACDDKLPKIDENSLS